jgi:hypothetical protein
MQREDRGEILPTPQVPAFCDSTRRYLGIVIGFSGNSVCILLDDPVSVHRHSERMIRVPVTLPIPVGKRFVEGRGWVEMDLRYLCAASPCMNASTTLVALEDGCAICCDECSAIVKQSAFFISATPLAMIEELV